jgi:preprotein translocase subunit SecY
LTVKIKNSNKPVDILLPRILVTIGILFLIRTGTFLPVPGIDPIDLDCYIQRTPVAKNLISTFAGDNAFVIGLFTLNIFPFVNATIFVQLLIAFSPRLAQLQKEGDFEGRRTISRLTRNIALLVSIGQSVGIALYLRPALFEWNILLASEIVLWLTSGAMIVLWLSEIITDYGLGNGSSLLIYINIVSNLPNLSKKLLLANSETSLLLSFPSILILIGLGVASFYGIVFLQNGTFKIPLISARQLNQSSFQDRNRKKSYLPLRFNQAGVMPVILTTSFLVVPRYLINLGLFPWLKFLASFESNLLIQLFYWIGYFVLILAFSSFYSSIVLNPKDLSDQLQKQAVKIYGVRPGVSTVLYLKREIQRLTRLGAILLASLTIIPNFIESTFHLTGLNGLSTTSFLILGGVILDLKREIKDIFLSTIYRDLYQ